MPIASSSAMCLSRATGSRPVQPAITARSIAKVNGVVPSLVSMVKVRSNMDRSLHTRRQFEDAAIVTTRCAQHEADRRFAVTMARQRNGAAIHHVDQRGIAQRQQDGFRERMVIGEIWDSRRRDR